MIRGTFLLILLILSGVVQVYGQPFVSDSTARRLRIKTVVKNTFFGESSAPSMIYTESYDEAGDRTKLVSFNNHLKTVSIQDFFFYNQKHQVIEQKSSYSNDSDTNFQVFSYNEKGLVDSNDEGTIDYQYNEVGKVVKKTEKTGDFGMLTTTYAYDSLGRLTTEECRFTNYPQHRTNWKYNDQGQLIEEISSSFYSETNDWIADRKNNFIYDQNGLITIEYQQEFSSGGTVIGSRKYTYVYSFQE